MERLPATELERLHRAYADGVFRFCWIATRSRQDAEDLLQDFFVKLARTKSRCKDAENERAWIFTSARNLTTDWHRKNKRKPLEIMPTEIVADDPDAEHLGHELQSALATLPDEQREVAALRLWEDLSLAEIAEIQGVPLQTVASRLRYALERLRKQLHNIYTEIQ